MSDIDQIPVNIISEKNQEELSSLNDENDTDNEDDIDDSTVLTSMLEKNLLQVTVIFFRILFSFIVHRRKLSTKINLIVISNLDFAVQNQRMIDTQKVMKMTMTLKMYRK